MRKSVLGVAIAVALAAVIVVAVIVVIKWVGGSGDLRATAECSVPAVPGAPVTVVVEGPQTAGAGAAGNAELGASAAPSTSVTSAPDVFLNAVQLQHASTINAVGLRRGLPERARVIAIATAWQESTLRNLPSGDRDSVGLFQQRPSQGWGTPEQLTDPVYASGKFYDELVKVPLWQTMSLTMAAQQVQYSGFPDAYAQWEPRATTLARELGGSAMPLLSCGADAQASTVSPPSRPRLAGTSAATAPLSDLLAAGQAELGGLKVLAVSGGGKSATLTVTVPGLSADRAARTLSGWLVAHAAGFSVASVSTQGRQWRDHSWQDGPAGAADQVTVAVS